MYSMYDELMIIYHIYYFVYYYLLLNQKIYDRFLVDLQIMLLLLGLYRNILNLIINILFILIFFIRIPIFSIFI